MDKLKKSTAAGPNMCLSSIVPVPAGTTDRGMANATIVIVGAGPAGLAAASALILAGIESVLVLEAADRIGGRIHSLEWGGEGKYVEFGAQWVHGVEGNVAYKIADEMNLVDDPKSGFLEDIGEDFYTEDGKSIGENEVDRMWNAYEKVEKLADKHDSTKTETTGQFIDTNWKQVVGHRGGQLVDMFKDYMHRELMILESFDNWYKGSFYGTNEMYENLPGIDVTFKADHKYTDILKHFTDDIPRENIRLGAKVKKIKMVGAGISLDLEGDERLAADYVIFTPSVGVLKWAVSDGILFDPPLSENKVRAIKSVGFGTVGKIFIRYDEIWWPKEDFEGYAFLYNDSSNYTEIDAESDWTRSILGLYVVRHKPDILMAWIAGAGARKMEMLSDEQVRSDIVAMNNKFFGKDYPNMPQPADILVTRWHSDPLVRGSYSFQTVDSVKMDAVSKLAEPAMDRRLLFAGEATHPKHFSTVHGAIASGWRASNQIIKMLMRK